MGEPLEYTLRVENRGPATAAGVVVTDQLPSQVTPGPMSAGCSVTGTTVTCNLGTIQRRTVKSAQIVVTPTEVGPLTNTATVTFSGDDPVAANNNAGDVADVVDDVADDTTASTGTGQVVVDPETGGSP